MVAFSQMEKVVIIAADANPTLIQPTVFKYLMDSDFLICFIFINHELCDTLIILRRSAH